MTNKFIYDNITNGEFMLTINEFIKNITITDEVKNHLNNTMNDLEKYLSILTSYSLEAQYQFLYDYLVKETIDSIRLERQLYSSERLKMLNDVFLIDGKINHEKIKCINKCMRANDKILSDTEFEKLKKEKNKMMTYIEYKNLMDYNLCGNYRKDIIWIGDESGIEYALHIPPRPELIQNYMDDFIKYYNDDKLDNDLNNPIIKAALIHIIFIKIHPFANGNGRTVRILMNNYLKRTLNKQYDLNVIFPPINLSKSFDLSRLSYFQKQNDIKYDSFTDNNIAFNKWFDYVLVCVDEQLYFLNNRLEHYKTLLESMSRRKSL